MIFFVKNIHTDNEVHGWMRQFLAMEFPGIAESLPDKPPLHFKIFLSLPSVRKCRKNSERYR